MKNWFATLDLRKLDSLTKYPSIPTYHTLDPKTGKLHEPHVEFSETALATEKIDGTNTRIILRGEDMIVGSREEFLWASGDLIHNPALGIVDTVRKLYSDLSPRPMWKYIHVVYGETYGGNTTPNSKQYTKDKKLTGLRVFDVARFTDDELDGYLEWPIEKFSGWRERGGQPFLHEGELTAFCGGMGLKPTPTMGMIPAAELPKTVEDAAAFLKAKLLYTVATLDGTSPGQGEGIVLRTLDRKTIAKLRFEDYRRSLR